VDALKCAKDIVTKLREVGHRAFFAGGWVRDHLLGIESSDIDIATDALPEEIVQIFPEHVLVGAQFGVVLVLYDKFQFEVATFRHDVRYEDGRTPAEVALQSTPQEDARRRDFTINGLFFDPVTNAIFDYVGGKEDLQKKVIRTIGDPVARFQEDRLRMIRAIRFAFKFGFAMDEATKNAIIQYSSTLLPAVSMERIWQEFCKMREGPNFKEALLEMHKLKLLPVIFPPLQNVSLEELEKRLQGVETLSEKVPCILILAQLFSPNDATYVDTLYVYLRCSREDGKWIEALKETLKFLERPLATVERYNWAKFLSQPRTEICLEVILEKLAPEVKQNLVKEFHNLSVNLEYYIHMMRKKEAIVRSHDLVALGIEPGVKMGKLLDEAERISVNYNLKTKGDVLDRLIKAFPSDLGVE